MKKLLSGVGAAVGVKLLTGIAVAAAAVTVAAAATEVASTGSINPVDWGKQVTQQVQTCKDTLRASGTRGIGQCVSQFAKQHGKVVSGEHRASDARGHGQGSSNDKGSGKNKSHDNGSNNGHAPLTVPTGEPTGLPRP